MSEVPDYEQILNEYVMNSFYPNQPDQCNSPVYVGNKVGLVQCDVKACVAPASPSSRPYSPCQPVQESQRQNIYDVNPLTPPIDTENEVLRKMSQSDIFNALSPENDNKFDGVSPATIYQSRGSPMSRLLTSLSDAGIYGGYNGISSCSNSDHSDTEDVTFASRATFSTTGSVSNTSSTPAVKKPKRKTRLCALTQQEKSERRKRQNRLAASRCRKKKQAALTEMEGTANKVRSENAKLLDEIAELKAVIAELKKNQGNCTRECCVNSKQ